MNELEICKRIAEIENINVSTNARGNKVAYENCYGTVNNVYDNGNDDVDDNGYDNCYDNGQLYYGDDDEIYDPINDDGLCFKLMVKYQVTMDWERRGFLAYITQGKGFPPIGHGKTSNEAICLAIIALFK